MIYVIEHPWLWAMLLVVLLAVLVGVRTLHRPKQRYRRLLLPDDGRNPMVRRRSLIERFGNYRLSDDW
ncbi:MAG: hypothetical protein UX68_C0016G0002 [Parcubacteria group bacterium GW2011_GWA2_46_9]|nr:MAG: hypothetical protein UX68_C0016G0002 [Parcubacteria group bacterium GW2011_GWA2_46_9]